MDAGGHRVLSDVTIIDFSHYIAGSMATMLLADLGATVWKIESAAHPDGIRERVALAGPAQGSERPGSYQFLRGKRSVEINFKTRAGRDTILRLVRNADVVVENFRDGALDNSGLDYNTLLGVNPGIILVSIRAFVMSRQMRAVRAGAPAAQAMSGVDAAIGYPGGPPLALGRPMADTLAGLNAAVGVLAALARRRMTGRGERLVIGLDQSLVSAFAGIHLHGKHAVGDEGRAGNSAVAACPYNYFPCQGDDSWISIACGSDDEWRGLVAALGEPAWSLQDVFGDAFGRCRNKTLLEQHLAEETRAWPAQELAVHLQDHGVPAMPLRSAGDRLRDSHLGIRGTFAWLEHPEIGVHPVVNTLFQMTSIRSDARWPAPSSGADSAELPAD
jgi:benzylsuccinate CoA-transferase BbsF subunit